MTNTDMTPVRPCCRRRLILDLQADLQAEPPAIDATTALLLAAEANDLVTAQVLPEVCSTCRDSR